MICRFCLLLSLWLTGCGSMHGVCVVVVDAQGKESQHWYARAVLVKSEPEGINILASDGFAYWPIAQLAAVKLVQWQANVPGCLP